MNAASRTLRTAGLVRRNRSGLAVDEYGLETRLGARLAGALNVSAQQLPHDLTERLRFAREQALGRARVRTASVATTAVAATGRGELMLGGFAPWWQRAASLFPLLVLVLGLVAIDRWTVREQVLAAADIDTQLLSDNLPPAAYSDPGFAEFLRSAPAP